jgi:hypothetical protein
MKENTAVGITLSPMLSEIFVEHFEELTLKMARKINIVVAIRAGYIYDLASCIRQFTEFV